MTRSTLEIFREPLALPAETLPNRLAKSAISEGLADREGSATEKLARLYRAWSRGGAGLIVTGHVMIDHGHRQRPGDVVVTEDVDADQLAALKAWSAAARERGAGAWMQLSHAGGRAPRLMNAAPRAPLSVCYGKGFGIAEALSEAEIVALANRFSRAAQIAREGGFSGVQIEAGGGRLVSQFLAPENQRDDEWGGALENRVRFLVEAVRKTRLRAGRDFSLSVKLSVRPGPEEDETLAIARALVAAGVDLIEIAGEPPPPQPAPKQKKAERLALPPPGAGPGAAPQEAWGFSAASEIVRALGVPVMLTGGLRSAAGMARALEKDGMALIGLGRPLCFDPAGPAKLLSGASRLEKWEDKLQMGPGWLGPESPLKPLRALNGRGVASWFQHQVRRMGDGLPPEPSLQVFSAYRRERKAG